MTRDDVIMILATLKAAYPHAYKGMTRRDGEALVNLWQRQFADEDPNAVQAAVDALIATRTAGYSITPGEVKEKLHTLRTVNELNESDAWALVSKACSNGLYGYREEFAKLPPEVQQAVGRPEQLREWSQMDENTVQSVVASNFMRSFRTTQQRNKELSMIPAEVREMLSDVTKKLELNAAQAQQLPEPEPAAAPEALPAAPAAVPIFRDLSELIPERETYTPPADEDWIKMRDEALSRLEKGGQ